MANYEPRDPGVPRDIAMLQRYLVEELRVVAGFISEIEGVLLNELNVAPSKPRNGQIVLADGTDFNPGNGAGFYGRSKGAWTFLANTGGGGGGGGISAIVTKTASYTPVLGEADAYFRMNSGSANTFTVPPVADVNFAIPTELHVRMVGAGQTSIAAGAGVTINKPTELTLNILAAGYTASLLHVATNSWDLSGALVLA